MTYRRTRRHIGTVVIAAISIVAVSIASSGVGSAQQDATTAAVPSAGYVLVNAAGEVAGFGDGFTDFGDLGDLTLAQPIVDVQPTPTGQGYWMVASDGGVFSLGDATFFGSAASLPLEEPIVGMASTPAGDGYWLVASDGGVFTYGAATFHGSTGAIDLVSPITDLHPTPTGDGYWLVASDGGVFTFGGATFHGSLGGAVRTSPVVGMASTGGTGYWLVDSVGAVTPFGDAADPDDLVEQGITLGSPVVSVSRNSSGEGLTVFTAEGAAFPIVGGAPPPAPAGATAAQAGGPYVAAALVPEVFELHVLHNNDGESSIANGGGDLADFGGVAHFATLVDQLRAEATGPNTGSILLSSGDNFLAGTALQASFERADAQPGTAWYDSIALDSIGYDALAIGNHEFDFGPARLADFINGFNGDQAFLSANLDFSAAPELQALVTAGQIAPSTVVEVAGQRIGVVGISPPELRSISSPGPVVIDENVVGAIQREVDALTADGISIVIVISHLQGIDAELEAVEMLRDVDVVIAGGGDELLAGPGDLLVDDAVPFGEYPQLVDDADGQNVPVITTPGNYLYVGRLILTFDGDSNLIGIADESGLVRVANGSQPDAVAADPAIQAKVVDPIVAFQAGLAADVIADQQVTFDNNRGTTFGVDVGKRVQETNLGNLFADSLLWQAREVGAGFGVLVDGDPAVAVQNGGGIRSDTVYTAPRDFTRLDSFDIAPFANFVAVVEDVSATDLKAILEQSYSGLPGSSGGFLQVANMVVDVDLAQPVGSRVQELTVDTGGTPVDLVDAGALTAAAATTVVDVVSNNFTAAGGDDLPFPAGVVTVGSTYEEALSGFIQAPAADGGLAAVITAADYPVVGVGGSGASRILISAAP